MTFQFSSFLPFIDAAFDFDPRSIGNTIVAWFMFPCTTKVIIFGCTTRYTWSLPTLSWNNHGIRTGVAAYHFYRGNIVPTHDLGIGKG